MHNVLYISKKINKIVSQSNFIWVSNSTLIESLSSSKIDVLFHSEFPGGTHVVYLVYLSFGAPYPAISILFYLFKWVVIRLRKISVLTPSHNCLQPHTTAHNHVQPHTTAPICAHPCTSAHTHGTWVHWGDQQTKKKEQESSEAISWLKKSEVKAFFLIV